MKLDFLELLNAGETTFQSWNHYQIYLNVMFTLLPHITFQYWLLWKSVKMGWGRNQKTKPQNINADAEFWSDICQKHRETGQFWMVPSVLAKSIRNVVRKGKYRLERSPSNHFDPREV